MSKMNSNMKINIAEENDKAKTRTKILMTAAITRHRMGPVYAELGSLYIPKLKEVVEPKSLVAEAVNPMLSTPSSEVKSASVARSSDYKAALFNDDEEKVKTPSTTKPQEEEPRSTGLGRSSSSM